MERKNVEQPIVDWANANGWIHLKLNVIGRRAWPDQLFIAQGPIIVFMEMKDKDKKPRILQNYVMGILHYLGCHVTWVDTAKEGITYLGKLYKGPRIMGAATVSRTVPKKDDDAGSSGGIPKAWEGQNVDHAYWISNTEKAEARKQTAGDSSPTSVLSHLAVGNPKVVPFSLNARDPTRKG